MRNQILLKFKNQTLKGKQFNELVDLLWDFLPKNVLRETVYESVRYLAGVKLTPTEIDTVCWRLAGNAERLSQRRIVSPWIKQSFHEWVPAQVIRVRVRRGGRMGREFGHEILFKILAGTSCTLEVRQWWSAKKSKYLSRYKDAQGNGFCFSRPVSNSYRISPHVFHSVKQFVTLRCLLLIDPALCDEGPDFNDISFSSALTQWNREQQKFRARLEEGYTCPWEFPTTEPCHTCPIGLDKCRAATHAKTYELRACSQCDEAEVWFDPEDKTTKVCVNCTENNSLYPPSEKEED